MNWLVLTVDVWSQSEKADELEVSSELPRGVSNNHPYKA